MPNNKHLISVVIPVYNVGQFLSPCINSVLAQTYERLEIILIDDGSTDGSSSVCDKYAESDHRVIAIHQPNLGLSAARNTGLDNAKGEYITFVDSDDLIHPDYIMTLYSGITAHNADISSVEFKRISSLTETKDSCQSNTILNMDGKKAMRYMLYQNIIDNSACCKLFKTSLFDDIRFPQGLFYEDLATIPIIYFHAKKTTHLRTQLYYYRYRNSSILGHFSLKRADVLDVTEEIEDFANLHCPENIPAARSRRFSANMNILLLMSACKIDNESLKSRCWKNIRTLRKEMLKDRHVRLKNKIGALASYGGLRLTQSILGLFK